jgi:hypothetical protein
MTEPTHSLQPAIDALCLLVRQHAVPVGGGRLSLPLAERDVQATPEQLEHLRRLAHQLDKVEREYGTPDSCDSMSGFTQAKLNDLVLVVLGYEQARDFARSPWVVALGELRDIGSEPLQGRLTWATATALLQADDQIRDLTARAQLAEALTPEVGMGEERVDLCCRPGCLPAAASNWRVSMHFDSGGSLNHLCIALNISMDAYRTSVVAMLESAVARVTSEAKLRGAFEAWLRAQPDGMQAMLRADPGLCVKWLREAFSDAPDQA